ncbi:DUF1232 domain-containing protein [bacterium]|nr:DUF1232 domain-containing protein [bacterium]
MKIKSIIDTARKAGIKTASLAFTLWFALNDPETPVWAKTTILAALGYLVLPADSMPDFVPAIGFGDDAAALAAALVVIAAHVKPEHSEQGKQKAENLFGTAT